IARVGAANFLGLIMCKNPGQFLACVMYRCFLLDLVILGAALARGVALGAEAPAITLRNQIMVLVVKFATVDLLDGTAGETGLMLDQVLEPDPGGELIAQYHRPMPGHVDAGEHRMHSGQAPDVAAE